MANYMSCELSVNGEREGRKEGREEERREGRKEGWEEGKKEGGKVGRLVVDCSTVLRKLSKADRKSSSLQEDLCLPGMGLPQDPCLPP